jgi:hypothetical protein
VPTPDERLQVVRRRYGRVAKESSSVPAVKRTLSTAGLERIRTEPDERRAEFISEGETGRGASEYVASAIGSAPEPRR